MDQFFCLTNDVPQIPKEALINTIKSILTLSPNARSNQHHNHIYKHFAKSQPFFIELEKRRNASKLLFAIQSMRGLQHEKSGSFAQECKSFYLCFFAIFFLSLFQFYECYVIDKINRLVSSSKYIYVLAGTLTVVTSTSKLSYGPKSTFQGQTLLDVSDAYTKQGCVIAYLTIDDYQSALKANTKQFQDTVHKLSALPLLKNLRHQHLLYLAQRAVYQEYLFKQVVYEVGQPSTNWYAILKGQFQLFVRQSRENQQAHMHSQESVQKIPTKPARNMRKNRIQAETSVLNLEAGQSFGEDEVFLETQRYCSVKCMSSENRVIILRGEQLKLVLMQYPQTLHNLVRAVHDKKKLFDEVVSKKQVAQQTLKHIHRHDQPAIPPEVRTQFPNLKESNINHISNSSNNAARNTKTYSHISKTLKHHPFQQQLLSIQQKRIESAFGTTSTNTGSPNIMQSPSQTLRQQTQLPSNLRNSTVLPSLGNNPTKHKRHPTLVFPQITRLDLNKSTLPKTKQPQTQENISTVPLSSSTSPNHQHYLSTQKSSSGFIDPNMYIHEKQQVLRKIQGPKYRYAEGKESHGIQSIDDINDQSANRNLLMPVKFERRHLLMAGKLKSASNNSSSKDTIRSKKFMENFLKGVLMRKGAYAGNLGETVTMLQKVNEHPKMAERTAEVGRYHRQDEVLWENPFDAAFFTPI